MDNSKNGWQSGSDLGLNASPHLRPDTSSTLQKAKQFARESRQRMLQRKTTGTNLVVSMSEGVSKGARMLSVQEMEILRQTKQSVAKHTMEVLSGTV